MIIRKFTGRIALASLCATVTAISVAARAEELSAPLEKGEVASLVTDKKINYVRRRDGAKQGWDFKSGGTVYFNTSTTTRNTTFSGTYTLEDNGAVCFKWNPDKYLTLNDGCIVFRRDGGKLVVATRREPATPFGDVVE